MFPELVLKKLDGDANEGGVEAANIKCYPTFKVYKNGKEVEKMEGADEKGLM